MVGIVFALVHTHPENQRTREPEDQGDEGDLGVDERTKKARNQGTHMVENGEVYVRLLSLQQ
jgi:hypothetical protein